jgi:hypothetical protein
VCVGFERGFEIKIKYKENKKKIYIYITSFISEPIISATRSLFTSIESIYFEACFLHYYIMPEQSKEARILIAIGALQSNSKLSMRKAAKTYDVPFTTLHDRMNGATFKAELRPKNRLLDELEEKILLDHIIDLDNRGFSLKIEAVEDIANYILASRKQQRVSKL